MLNNKLPDVFIVSSGRSGTTLLSSILNSSKQIHIPYESDFIARAYPHYQNKKQFSKSDYQQIVRFFNLTSKPIGWGMSSEYLLSFLCESAPQSFPDIISAICVAYHKQQQTEDLVWGIKAPVLIASLDVVFAICENAKIVHIVRDGRDVCLSYRKIHEKSQVKFGPERVWENALYWVDGLRKIQKIQNTNQIHELRYEDLLHNSEQELTKLCNFIGIEYDSAMYTNYSKLKETTSFLPKELMQNVHGKLQGGLDSKNTKKYLVQMSKLDLFVFELIAIPYLMKYEYEPDYLFLNSVILSPLRGILYFLARVFNNLRYRERDQAFFNRSRYDISEKEEHKAS